MTEAHIRVVVVDDHTLIRQGIVGLLASQSGIEVVGEAGTARDAVQLAGQVKPDVMLMDISMPGGTGLEATREIRAAVPSVRVVILTMHDREDYLHEALRVGASGYVLKGADVQELLQAVRAASRGEVYLYPDATKVLIDDYIRSLQGGERDPYDRLSEREREVLRLIAQGRTSAEIAASLVLSPHTVQSHRDHLMTKLGLHSTGALIRYAIAKGLVEL
ncbi:MAG: response regulator transcription factor [Chloroflexi bacterium]|nr:response regulator transcription factor [Chloroflexota bacterium]